MERSWIHATKTHHVMAQDAIFYYLQDTNYCYHCSGDIWAIKQLLLYLYLQRQQYIFFVTHRVSRFLSMSFGDRSAILCPVIPDAHLAEAGSRFGRLEVTSWVFSNLEKQGPHPVRTECNPKPFQATNESEKGLTQSASSKTESTTTSTSDPAWTLRVASFTESFCYWRCLSLGWERIRRGAQSWQLIAWTAWGVISGIAIWCCKQISALVSVKITPQPDF